MKRLVGFLKRVLRGEDIVLVPQTKEQWEQQFAAGTWNKLQEGQLNTIEIARLIRDYRDTKEGIIRVLDIGCGNGGLARILSTEPAVAYTGIDISETALATARAVMPGGRFIVADAEQPPADIGTFDVFVFNEVLYYMNPDRVLPRYHTHAVADARVFVSVVRFWRTPFIFQRIRHHLRIDDRFQVINSSHRWDIGVGRFV